MVARRVVVITDLDGCLLHPFKYSYEEAEDIIDYLRDNNIPIVFCSTKTRVEQEFFRKKLGIRDPFIVENGAATYIPRGYFGESYNGPSVDDYIVIEYGIKREKLKYRIRPLLARYRSKVVWIDEMPIEYLMRITGLPEEQAPLAKVREYSLVYHPIDRRAGLELAREAEALGLKVFSGSGILYTITGHHDKGRATRELLDLYRRAFNRIISIGVGDSPIDIHLLNSTDIAVVLGNNIPLEKVKARRIIHVSKRGPYAWSIGIELALKSIQNIYNYSY